MRRGSAARAQSGLAYLGVLMLAAAIAAGLAATARPWSMQQQRAREAELLFIGQQFQRAIASYYRAGPSPAFPRSLDALLKDSRVPFMLRHLRRLYRDPLTGSADWGVVKGPDGGVIGVYSQAPGKPLKQDGFPASLGISRARALRGLDLPVRRAALRGRFLPRKMNLVSKTYHTFSLRIF